MIGVQLLSEFNFRRSLVGSILFEYTIGASRLLFGQRDSVLESVVTNLCVRVCTPRVLPGNQHA